MINSAEYNTGAFAGTLAGASFLEGSDVFCQRASICIAKDVLRHGYARRCEVQLAYAIGVAEPVSVSVDCFGTQRIPKPLIVNWIRKNYDLTPAGIITSLTLRDVDYTSVASYGHFWRGWMPWEK